MAYLLGSREDVGADISISGPNVQENSDRVLIGNISVSGISFERTLEIRPLSAGDTGNYHCTGTVLSATRNPLVIGQTEMRSDAITVYSECKHSVKPASPVHVVPLGTSCYPVVLHYGYPISNVSFFQVQ